MICKHGLDEKYCAACQQERGTEPLRLDALRVTEEGNPALILRTVLTSLSVQALVLDGAILRLETIREISLRHPMTVPSVNPRKVLKVFLDRSLQQGYLFQITYGVTKGEGTPMNFSNPGISNTGSQTSFPPFRLGCTQCGKPVGSSAHCLCGNSGEDGRGQTTKYPALPITHEERLEYIRVVRFCLANIEQKPRAKVLLFSRDGKT